MSLATFALVSVALVVTATISAAAPSAAPKATGSVALAYVPNGPQYVEFNAITGSPVKGSVTYTSFGNNQTGSGSNVWNLNDVVHIVFQFDLYGERDHTMNVTSVTALSPYKISFTATGSNDGQAGTDWNSSGVLDSSVDPAAFSMNLVYTDPPYVGMGANLNGTVADNGLISGAFTSDWGPGSWSATSAHEVYSFTADVTCVSVTTSATPRTANFGATVPTSPVFPGLNGLNLVFHVTDNGSPGATYDTYHHGVDSGPGACTAANATYGYDITSGNIVVH